LPTGAIVLVVAAAATFVWWSSGRRFPTEGGEEGAPAVVGKICVVPIGEVAERDLAFARDVAEASFGREALVYEPLPLQEVYYYPERGQYGANGFLRYVEANAPRGAYRVLGVTAQDIFAGDLNFLFGIGRCPGKCAVVSTYRFGFYCDTAERRDVRFAKLIVHELGHTFGLLHCRQTLCVMKFAVGYETLDGTRLAACARCERSLRAVAAVDAGKRRTKLEEVLKNYGLWEEAGGAAGLEPPPAPADLSPEKLLP
jgi:archaemetzincin